jgi:hypothetical protein
LKTDSDTGLLTVFCYDHKVMKVFLSILFSLMALSAPAMASGNIGREYPPIVCKMPKAPVISIAPVTADVVYDYTLNSRQLAMKKSDTVSPYAPGTDTTTGGMREDQPVEKVEISWGYATYTPQDMVCMWYDKVTVTINLSPRIYLANDGFFANPVCHDAIVGHELKHVAVDHQVMNDHALALGKVLEKAVNEGGVVGPFPADQLKEMQKSMVNPINRLVEALQPARREEMTRLQGQVDSLQEYQRVSGICNAAMGRTQQNPSGAGN